MERKSFATGGIGIFVSLRGVIGGTGIPGSGSGAGLPVIGTDRRDACPTAEIASSSVSQDLQ